MTDANEEKKASAEKLTTTIEVDKELFLKFKALCVLKEDKMSSVIENMIKSWVDNASTSISIESPKKEAFY
jgi:Ribonuclease G/E